MTLELVTVKVNGEYVSLEEARRVLLIPPDYCVGCWLGDDSPDAHDYEYGCDRGEVVR